MGSIKQIMEIMDNICFGPYQFQVALVLRNSLFLNSLMFNSEAWYNVSNQDIDELERVDEILLRKILECPESTPKEMLYLERSMQSECNQISEQYQVQAFKGIAYTTPYIGYATIFKTKSDNYL